MEWTQLELQNGWKPIERFNPPAYRVEDEKVYLRGVAVGGELGTVAFKFPIEMDAREFNRLEKIDNTWYKYRFKVEENGNVIITEQKVNI